MKAERLQLLVEMYRDGNLGEAEFQELQVALSANPDLGKVFDAELQMAAQLDSLSRDDLDDFSSAVIDSLMDASLPLDVSQPVLRELHRSEQALSRRWTKSLALAAGFVIALGITAWLVLQPDRVKEPAIAVLHDAIETRWASDSPMPVGTDLHAQIIAIEEGVIRLDFSNGAIVTLQGPARFELVSTDKTILHEGVLTAVIPPSAHGFQIDTAAIRVVDLGTAFGVSVNGAGAAEVCAFEGEVEVSLPDGGKVPQLLKESEAVHAVEGSGRFNRVAYDTAAYDTAAYHRSRPVASGVVDLTGAFQFVRPGPPWDLEAYESDEAITVFPEHDRIELNAPPRVDLAAPETELVGSKSTRKKLPKGTILRSYLLQFNPTPRPRGEQGLQLTGSITFGHPLLGVLAGNSNLPNSDEVFGHAASRYGQGKRGLEGPGQDNENQQPDRVHLSADRRTLTLELLSRSEPDPSPIRSAFWWKFTAKTNLLRPDEAYEHPLYPPTMSAKPGVDLSGFWEKQRF